MDILVGGIIFLVLSIIIVCLQHCLFHCWNKILYAKSKKRSEDIECGPGNDDNTGKSVTTKQEAPDEHHETETEGATTVVTNDNPNRKGSHIDEDSAASSTKKENILEQNFDSPSVNTVTEDIRRPIEVDISFKPDTLLIESESATHVDTKDNPYSEESLAVTEVPTTEIPETEHLQNIPSDAQSENAVNDDSDTVKIQIVCKPDIPLMHQATAELMSKLNPELRDNYTIVQDITDTCPDIPLLILCGAFTRLGTDARNAIKGMKSLRSTALLILHNREAHALPSNTSDKILTGTEFSDIGGIFDMAYNHHNGMYSCDTNTKCVQDLSVLLLKILRQVN